MKKILIILLCVFFVGCHTKEIIREVPVETIREVENKVYVHDSVYQKEYVNIYIKGDTVCKDSIVFIYTKKETHDTVEMHDTIPQIINTTNTKIVKEKDPQWWPVWLSLGIIGIYLLLTKTKIIKYIKQLLKLFK